MFIILNIASAGREIMACTYDEVRRDYNINSNIFSMTFSDLNIIQSETLLQNFGDSLKTIDGASRWTFSGVVFANY